MNRDTALGLLGDLRVAATIGLVLLCPYWLWAVAAGHFAFTVATALDIWEKRR